MNIVGIYLAAGQSKRFCGDKLAAPLWGEALGSFTLNAALQSKLSHTLVITKENNISWLHPFLKNPACTQIICKLAELGQAESIKCGLTYAKTLKADAILIMLADQPLVTKSFLNILIGKYKLFPEKLFVASKYLAEIYPPIIISKKMFSRLDSLTGDHGAKKLLLNHQSEGYFSEFFNPWYFFDIDTKADLQLLQTKNLL